MSTVQQLLEAEHLLGEIRYVTKVSRSPEIQAFALCVVTVNDEHTKPRLKTKLRG